MGGRNSFLWLAVLVILVIIVKGVCPRLLSLHSLVATANYCIISIFEHNGIKAILKFFYRYTTILGLFDFFWSDQKCLNHWILPIDPDLKPVQKIGPVQNFGPVQNVLDLLKAYNGCENSNARFWTRVVLLHAVKKWCEFYEHFHFRTAKNFVCTDFHMFYK